MKKQKVTALLLAFTVFVSVFADGGMTVQAKKTNAVQVAQEVTDEIAVTVTPDPVEDSSATNNGRNGMYQDSEDRKHATGDEKFEREIERRLAERTEETIENSPAGSSIELPASVDNSTNENAKYCPPIGDQGGVGSCQYWADHYFCATYQYNKLMGTEVSEETTFSPRWYYANEVRNYFNYVNGFYTGMTLDRCPNINFSASDDDGTDFPADTLDNWLYSERIKISEERVDALEEIKEAIAEGNIVSVCTSAYWFQYMDIVGSLSPKNKKFEGQQIVVACMGKKNSDKGYHAISVVGYDDDIWVDLNQNGTIEEGEKGAFKFANSWGDNWGNDGYMWIAYDALNKTSAYIPLKDGYERENAFWLSSVVAIQEVQKQPQQYVVLTVNTKNRQLTMEAETDSSVSKYEIYGRMRSYRTDGTTYNFAGGTGYEDAQIVLPFTEQISGNQLCFENYQGDAATIKGVTYVDTVKQVSYDGLAEDIIFGEKKETKRISCIANTEVPYFKTFTANYVKGTVSGNIQATDSASGIKYAVKYGLMGSGEKKTATVDANGNYSFIPDANGEYRVEVTATDAKGNTATRYKRVLVRGVPKAPVIYSVVTREDGYYQYFQSIKCISSNADDVEYKFTYSMDGGEEVTIQEYSKSSSVYWAAVDKPGVYTIKVYAKNEFGVTTATTTTKIHKMQVALAGISPEAFAYTVGTPITIKLDITENMDEPSCTLNVLGDSGSEKVTDVSVTEKKWTPTKAGTYRLWVSYLDGSRGWFFEDLPYITVVDTIPDIKSFTSSVTSPTNNLKAGKMTLTANVTETNEKYEYRFGGIFDGATTYFNEYSTSNTYNMQHLNYFRESRIGTHILFVDVKNPTTGEVARKTIDNFKVEKQSPVDSVSISDNPASVIDQTTIKVNLNEDADAENFVFNYGTIINGKTYYFNETSTADTSRNVIFAAITDYIADSTTLSQAIGTHKVFVKAFNTKTSETTITYLDNVKVEGLKITKFTASKENVVKVGEQVDFSAEAVNACTAYNNPHANYYVVKDGVETKLEPSNPFSFSMSGSWTPTEPGDYTIKCVVSDYYNQVATITKDYKVIGTELTTVYYENSNWDAAYIHYKTEKGSWTVAPGVKMERSKLSGYTWKYEIPLYEDGSSCVTLCFNNGNGSWDSRNGSNYTLSKGTYEIKNGNVNEVGLASKITFTVDKPSPVAIAESVTLKATVNTETQNYEYRFGTIFNGQETIFENGYSSNSSCLLSLGHMFGDMNANAVGTHTLFVDVKDTETGEVERKTIENYKIKGLEIKSFTTDKASPQKTGTAIKLSVKVENEATYRYNTYQFSVIKDGVETKLSPYVSVDYNVTWTPTEPGDYTLKYYICDNYGQKATKTLEYRIVDNASSTIYYQNTSWSQAYIHYKAGDGTWTTAPGVKMEESNEADGYKWKYVIDLEEADNAMVCFNNGSGNWDSNNGNNYFVSAGTYGIKNGNINPLIIVPTAIPTSTPTVAPTSTPTVAPTVTPTVTAKPTATPTPVFEITSIDTSLPSPQKVGSTIRLDGIVKNEGYPYPHGGYVYNFVIKKDGVETANLTSFAGACTVADWTPTEPGTYVITATTSSQYAIATATKSIEYVIKGDSNIATVYYSNDAWNQAYIHFKPNDGNWTTAPGIKMEKNTSANGYTWKYMIDLEEADGATVCFNNGNGSWDSNNSKNYSLGVGTYGIKNAAIEELQEGISLKISADKKVGGTYTQTTFNGEAENGTAPYKYCFAVMTAGETPTDNSYVTAKEDGTYSYTPYTAKEYIVYAKVTDAKGNTAETSMNYTVEGEQWGKFTATAVDHKPGTPVTLEAEYINYKPDSYNRYSFKIEKDGVSNTYSTGSVGTYVWTPTEEGTYTITAQFTTYTGSVYKKELVYEVFNGNTATIYYNTSWDNAYIHYCVKGGSWTSVPGASMTKTSEKDGYTYMYVIDLDEAESVTACFNNGSGSWDSNNGSNYMIKAGTYGVSNGSILEVK